MSSTTGAAKARRHATAPLHGGKLVLACVLLATGCHSSPGTIDPDPLVGGITLGGRPGQAPPVGRSSDPAELPTVAPGHVPAGPAALAVGAGDNRSTGADVTLSGPRAVEDGASGQAAEAGPSPIASSTRETDSYEQLQQMLAARGVVWQQLKHVQGDEWHFMCAIPDPINPNKRRVTDVRATGPMGLAAIRAAIEDIDQFKKTQP